MKLFGTDGIRGEVNQGYINANIIQKVAMACVDYFRSVKFLDKTMQHKFCVVIGKDTRLSGYMIESALSAGFLSMGADVLFLGPVPTPAVAMLTTSLRAHLGVMISASHNPYHDNGIKFFDSNGYKLDFETQNKIEELVFKDKFSLSCVNNIGKAKRIEDATGRYIEFVKSSFPKNLRLDGLKISLDCANGAAYKMAPRILWELGAEVFVIGDKPNGLNINDGYGATNVAALQMSVAENKSHIGIALDGDADRLIIVDENTNSIDGDKIIAVIAKFFKENNLLKSNSIVGTIMSNIGLERFLNSIDLKLIKANVGDKNVLDAMLQNNSNVGGEQSGHVILSDYSTTGDGILAALQILAILVQNNCKASDLGNIFKLIPQHHASIKLNNPIDLNNDFLQEKINKARKLLVDGDIVVRKSGTEPLIRITVQGDNANSIKEIANSLVKDFEEYINNNANAA